MHLPTVPIPRARAPCFGTNIDVAIAVDIAGLEFVSAQPCIEDNPFREGAVSLVFPNDPARVLAAGGSRAAGPGAGLRRELSRIPRADAGYAASSTGFRRLCRYRSSDRLIAWPLRDGAVCAVWCYTRRAALAQCGRLHARIAFRRKEPV